MESNTFKFLSFSFVKVTLGQLTCSLSSLSISPWSTHIGSSLDHSNYLLHSGSSISLLLHSPSGSGLEYDSSVPTALDSLRHRPKYHSKLQSRSLYWYSQTHNWYAWGVGMGFVEVGIYVRRYPCRSATIHQPSFQAFRVPIDLSISLVARGGWETYKVPNGPLITHFFSCWTWEMLFEFMNDSCLTQDPTQT